MENEMSSKLQRPIGYGPRGESYFSAQQMRVTFELGRRSMLDEILKTLPADAAASLEKLQGRDAKR
jgi:hypothetical protein